MRDLSKKYSQALCWMPEWLLLGCWLVSMGLSFFLGTGAQSFTPLVLMLLLSNVFGLELMNKDSVKALNLGTLRTCSIVFLAGFGTLCSYLAFYVVLNVEALEAPVQSTVALALIAVLGFRCFLGIAQLPAKNPD